MAVDSSSSPTPDRVILVTGGYDHVIKLWQAHTGVCLRTMQHLDSQVNALEIMPDKLMVAACGYQHIHMYDLVGCNPDPVMIYHEISKNISRVGFQEDGKWMYTGGEDATVRIWDLRTRHCQRIFQVSAPVNAACLHPNQVDILVGDQNGIIHLWNIKTDHTEQLIPEAEASIQDIAISADGHLMAAVNNKGRCYVWSLSSNIESSDDPTKISSGSESSEETTKISPIHKIEAHSHYALRCKFSPDSSLLVTTSGDCSAKVWRTSDFSLVREFRYADQRWVWDTAFSADSEYLFTGSSDGIARLWNVGTGNVERAYTGHQKPITALAFRDDVIS